MYVRMYQPFRTDMKWHNFIISVEIKSLEFRMFLLVDWFS